MPQSLVEQTLYKHASRLASIGIEFNWRATGFEEADDHVLTHLAHVTTGATRTIRSRYLFAADGGAVGARLLYGDDTLRHTGLTFRDGLPRPTRRGFEGSDRGYFGATISTRNCLAVSGACMMVARAAFDAVGGFQPDASAYPDADLCLRLRATGLRNVHTPWATLRLRDASPWDATPDDADASAFRARWLRLTSPDPYYGAHLTLRPPTFEFDPTS